MIRFRWSNFKKDGTPVIKDKEIERYAEAILRDYKPDLLKKPGKINPVHFLESYLGATVEYAYIYHQDGPGKIAGEAIFNDDDTEVVFDEDKGQWVNRKFSANTVIINNKIMDDGKEGFAEFTHLHEGGHIFLHQTVFARHQETLFDLQSDDRPRAARCLRSCLESEGKAKLKTQEDFREHQANTFAATMAMPPSIFIPTAKELIKDFGFSSGVCIVPDWKATLDWNDMIDCRDYEIIEKLSDLFTGSRSAIRVQLQKHKLLMTETEFKKQYSQKRLFI